MSNEAIVTVHTICGDGKTTEWTVDYPVEAAIGVFDIAGAHLPYTTDVVNKTIIVNPPIPYNLQVYLWYSFL